MTRRNFQVWCTRIAYTCGALSVLVILAIVIRSAVISS